jgi:branched-chain amino acid transport system substrate-binding protein
MDRKKLGALAFGAMLAAAACTPGGGASTEPSASAGGEASPAASGGASPAASAPAPTKGTLKIGASFPLSGNAAADGVPTLKGVQLAVNEINAAGGAGGYLLEVEPLDHSVNGKYNEQQGAADMQNFVSQPDVIGVVGPYNSAVAKVQIPIGNAAGLLQCSPANTNMTLTIPEFGAADLRKTNPDKNNYVRVAANDTIQGPAMADYDYNTLGLKNVLVVDDVTTFGKGVADTFQAAFEGYGGTVNRVGADKDTKDFNDIITAAKTKNPDGVYYGGIVTSGGGLLLKQLRQQGLTIPFTGPDGINNGTGKDKGSLFQIAGPDASKNTYSTVAAIGDFPAKADLDARYKEAFKADKDFNTPGAYTGPGYACTTIIADALKGFLAANPDADQAAIREGVRAWVTDASHSFETVLGTTTFDKNGDTSQPYISFYAEDPAGADGTGAWKFLEQRNYAKNP